MGEDDFKGGVHATLGTLLAVCAAYNLMRWCATKQRRNAVNAAIYGPLAVYEAYQTHYHWHP